MINIKSGLFDAVLLEDLENRLLDRLSPERVAVVVRMNSVYLSVVVV